MKPSNICIVGVFPPPLHGMSLITEYVRTRIAEFAAPHIIDYSPHTLNKSFSVRFLKLFRVTCCLSQFVLLMITDQVRCVYFGLSGGYGQVYDALFVGLARIFGKRLYLHHHGYQYLIHTLWPAKVLMMVAGSKAVHIVACEKMACDLKRLYPIVTKTRIISGIVALDLSNDKIRPRNEILSIGFLSNISLEKGVFEFLEIAKWANEVKLPLRFILAGPFQDNDVKVLVEERMAHLSNTSYIGAVYGNHKQAFFDSVDVFLFPSHNESEGLVIHEAMSRGVPVVTYSRGCIEQVVSEQVGLCLLPSDDFVKMTINKIIEWSANPAAYQLISQNTVKQFNYAQKLNLQKFATLCSEMLSV
jgi:glycosyltransferase involved in cell wall biosynthesis